MGRACRAGRELPAGARKKEHDDCGGKDEKTA
jgi:hypothetical protein